MMTIGPLDVRIVDGDLHVNESSRELPPYPEMPRQMALDAATPTTAPLRPARYPPPHPEDHRTNPPGHGPERTQPHWRTPHERAQRRRPTPVPNRLVEPIDDAHLGALANPRFAS